MNFYFAFFFLILSQSPFVRFSNIHFFQIFFVSWKLFFFSFRCTFPSLAHLKKNIFAFFLDLLNFYFTCISFTFLYFSFSKFSLSLWLFCSFSCAFGFFNIFSFFSFSSLSVVTAKFYFLLRILSTFLDNLAVFFREHFFDTFGLSFFNSIYFFIHFWPPFSKNFRFKFIAK